MSQQTSTQISGPAPNFVPYYDSLLQGVFNYANQPYQQYQGPRVPGMSDIQYQALSGIQNQMGNNPILGQASSLYSGMMGPGGGNPFMQQMIGDVTNQATQAYQNATGAINNRFTNPNSFGNSRHAMMQDSANEAFARGLGGALGQLQYNAYGDGLDRQMRAAQGAQGLQQQQFSQLLQGLQAGNVPRMIQQQQFDTGYQDWQQAQQHPMRMIELISNILSGTRSNQTVTSQPGQNQLSQILGGTALTLPLLLGGFNFLGN